MTNTKIQNVSLYKYIVLKGIFGFQGDYNCRRIIWSPKSKHHIVRFSSWGSNRCQSFSCFGNNVRQLLNLKTLTKYTYHQDPLNYCFFSIPSLIWSQLSIWSFPEKINLWLTENDQFCKIYLCHQISRPGWRGFKNVVD